MRGMGLAAMLVALVWVSAGLSSPTRTKPHLLVVATRPLVVQGTHFRARERVRVTATTTRALTRTVRTSAAGSFRVQFSAVSIGRCDVATVKAIGALGDHAASKVLRDQDCAPGLGP